MRLRFIAALALALNICAAPTFALADTGLPTYVALSAPELAEAKSLGLSRDAYSLAKQLGILQSLQRMDMLEPRVKAQSHEITLESLALRQALLGVKFRLMSRLYKTGLEIDSVVGETQFERSQYTALLSLYTSRANRKAMLTNAMGFIANGALWAVAEALAIPSANGPGYNYASGTTGIIAGIIPSAVSLVAMHELTGKHYQDESEPNMLGKLFGYPAKGNIDYPASVWRYLNSPAPKGDGTQSRLEVLLDRWQTVGLLPRDGHEDTAERLAIIAATPDDHRRVTIRLLTRRISMLDQVFGEVTEMKRLLLEIANLVAKHDTIEWTDFPLPSGH